MPARSPSHPLATIAIVAIVLGGPILGVLPLSAQSAPHDGSTFAVAQGSTCTVVHPASDKTQNVSEWYDYRNPYTKPDSDLYSSFGTIDYQEHQGSVLMFYAGSEGTSMVLLHDQLGDEDAGSTVTFEFTRLPSGEWAVRDDNYPNQDDVWDISGSSATIDWMWAPNRSDGGAYLGLEDLSGTIIVDARFNEDATYWGEWFYSDRESQRISTWTLKEGDGSVARSLALDRRVFIHRGSCQVTPPSASITGPEEVNRGTNVTFDASESTDDMEIGGYEWDFNGDGETDAVTTDATVAHSFMDEGRYNVTVTVFDTYGNGDTAELSVRVGSPSDGNQTDSDIRVTELSVDPDDPHVGDPIEFSAVVSNTGTTEGTMNVSLQLFGEVVETKQIRLAPGESTTVTFTRSISSNGTYTAVVGDERITVTVSGSNDDGGPSDDDTDRGVMAPGFDWITALVALLFVAFVSAITFARRT